MATALWTRALRRLIPRSLQSRLIWTYLFLLSLGLGVFITWVGLELQAAIVEQAEHELELHAYIMANALREPLAEWSMGERLASDAIAAMVDAYIQRANIYVAEFPQPYASALNNGMRVTIVDPTLQVLLSSDPTVALHREHAHPELLAAQAGLEQHNIRWDEWRKEERLFVAAPIVEIKEGQQRLLGIIQLSTPMEPLHVEIRHTWISLLTAGGVVLIAAALISMLLARHVSGPIRDLTAVTERMASGDLAQRVVPSGPIEIERLGQVFNRMVERIQEMMTRQQAFVANAAHELRSPLASLRLRIEMIQRHGWDHLEMAQGYLNQIAAEVENLQRVVESLLLLASLDEGQRPPLFPLDLAPVLYEVADEMEPMARTAGLHMQVDVPPHLPIVLANADMIRVAVRNLLDNAIQCTPAGGRITLRAAVEEGSAAPLDGQGSDHQRDAPGPALMIQVKDTGIGIPAEHLPHIFERFYRGPKAQARRRGSVGIGLSIVRAIVEAHGGNVYAESAPGQGSAFTICLPVAGQTGAPHSPLAPSSDSL